MDAVKQSPTTLAEYLNAEKLSMKAILQLAMEVDEGLIEASPDDMKRLAARMKDKADSYYYHDEQLASDSERLKKRIDMFQREKSRIDRERRSLQKLLLWNMESQNLEEIPGNEFIAILKKGRGQLVARDEPTATDKAKNPELVRTKYEWIKTEVKKAFTTLDENDDFRKRFEIQVTKKVKFEVKGKSK